MLPAILVACTSGNSFSERETEVINSYPEGAVMRLYTVDSEQDTEILRQVCDPVDASVITSPLYDRLLQGMLATVRDPSNEGVGIAAPQVGIPRRIIAVQRFDLEGEPFAFYLNPRITAASEELVPGQEGCLSVPDRSGWVGRHKSIVIEYNHPDDFTLCTEEIDGFTAVIFQHEIDHLDGILYTDKIIAPKDQSTEPDGQN